MLVIIKAPTVDTRPGKQAVVVRSQALCSAWLLVPKLLLIGQSDAFGELLSKQAPHSCEFWRMRKIAFLKGEKTLKRYGLIP